MYNTSIMAIDYQHVVYESRKELNQSVAERERLDKRINELRTALRALVKFIPEPERDEVMREVKNAKRRGVSLTESVVDLLSQSEHKKGLTTSQIRQSLEESGFDMEDYSQPLAVIMNTLGRLIEQKKVMRTFTAPGGNATVLYKITAAGLLKKIDGD
jgi:hypothetical protein